MRWKVLHLFHLYNDSIVMHFQTKCEQNFALFSTSFRCTKHLHLLWCKSLDYCSNLSFLSITMILNIIRRNTDSIFSWYSAIEFARYCWWGSLIHRMIFCNHVNDSCLNTCIFQIKIESNLKFYFTVDCYLASSCLFLLG